YYPYFSFTFFFNDPPPTEIYTLSLHDALPIFHVSEAGCFGFARLDAAEQGIDAFGYVVANRAIGAALWERLSGAPELTLRVPARSEEHTSELQSRGHLVCRLLLEKKKK